jgi:hypothetical protein
MWYATWKLMRKLQSTKQSTKVNTTTSALQDAKNPSKQIPKNMLEATRQGKVAVAVTTLVKPATAAKNTKQACLSNIF